MANVLRATAESGEVIDTFGFKDDFFEFVTTERWTSVLTDSGTAAAAGVGGILTLTPSDGSIADNDEAYAGTTASFLKPAVNKPLYAEALVQFTEAATNAANVAFGLASSVAADLIVDNGGGLRTTGTVIAIYKVDGETVWRCVSRNGSNVTISVSTDTAGGASYQRLGIEILDVNSTACTVAFTIDGRHLIDSTTGQPIKHNLILSGIAAASLFAGVKNGTAAQQTCLVDYAQVWQTR